MKYNKSAKSSLASVARPIAKKTRNSRPQKQTTAWGLGRGASPLPES